MTNPEQVPPEEAAAEKNPEEQAAPGSPPEGAASAEGIPPDQGPPPPPPTYGQPQPLSPSDERTWAMLSHLSVLLNLVTGILGPVAAFIIYLVFKDRSRYVAYHSMQSFIFQLIWWVGAGALAGIAWAVSGALAVIVIGIILMPLACLFTFLPVAALVYGVVGAIQTSQGQDFRYWLIGDWVRGTLEEPPYRS
ncbi:MAG: DUF4870 domain-containing protein [Anaerolineales bacterium]